ncbi:hypothetical protein D5E78_09015 [Vibrio parahaemolyticus]|uniref:hypothetical protein n=1 Tax=Vibrio parahaemolyticus TaxID=670 RepID=UPI0010D28CF3|nr:hypothetical protein [Vibrio parahaemolyticus]TBT51918.1 hypothetical protein D5E78_09015 [Vibrio parahaemolyticus]
MIEKLTLDMVAFSILAISFAVSCFSVRSIIIRNTALVVLHEDLSEKIPRWGVVSFVLSVMLAGVLYHLNFTVFYNAMQLLTFMLGNTFLYYVVRLLLNAEEIEKKNGSVIKSAFGLILLVMPLFAFSVMSSVTLCGCFPSEMCNC